MSADFPRRPRRTNQELKKDILEATRCEIEEKGFAGLTVVGISKRAGIEPSVFYKRYKDLDTLLEQYIQEYDYWHSALFSSFDKIPLSGYHRYAKEIFTSMVAYFAKDKSMQELILWELTEDNNITRITNQMREKYTKHITDTLEQYYRDKGLRMNFRVFSSILLSSIYFLISHKGKATFCGVDFKSKKGQKLLADTVADLVEKILGDQGTAKELLAVADKMKSKGIAPEVITECTGLPLAVVERL